VKILLKNEFIASTVPEMISRMSSYVQRDTKERELLKNPTKIEEFQEKKFDRN